MGGRKPKPPHLRLLEGNPGKRGISSEVRKQVKTAVAAGKGSTHLGSPPAWLSVRAKGIWRQLLKDKDVVWLEHSDASMLSTLCTALARLRDAEEAIKKHGLTYETVNGGIGMRPEVRIVNQCSALVRSLGSELGLSPAARVRLGTKTPEREKADDLPAELSGGPKNTKGA